MRVPVGLHLDYVSLAEYEAARWADVLGVAAFRSTPLDRTGANGVPVAQVQTPPLRGDAGVFEVWRGNQPAASGQKNHVHFRRTENMLFGCIAIDEADVSPERANGHTRSALHEATAQIYREICATLDAERYPHLLRVWNYVPDINGDSRGTERYREFNRARQQALRAGGRKLTRQVPAASALGAAGTGPLLVYFLAGRTQPVFVENPRQVSAYHYPRQYGTHPPVFSRATLLREAESVTLFVSGTASIVGHRSMHVGDITAQTRETLTNIEALLAEANRVARGAHFSLDDLAFKVYVRRPADLPVIQGELTSALGAHAQTLYLQADICRQDLLVEIEAAGMRPLRSAT